MNVERVNIIGMEIIMSRERLLYIDIARGISIILVVFGHIVDLTPFEKFFFSFHVPVFFMITGMMKKIQGGRWNEVDDVLHWLKKRLKTLIIPYIVFEIVFVLLNGCTWDVIRWNLIDVVTLHTRSFGPWFLICMFLAEFIFSFINSCVYNSFIRRIAVVFLFILPFVMETENYYVLMVFQAFIAVGFMEIGYTMIGKLSIKKLNLLYIVGLLVVYYIANANGLMGIYGLEFGRSKVLFLFSTIIGTISFMGICTNFNKLNYFTKIISFFGRNSLWFLGFHGPVILIMKTIVETNSIWIQIVEVFINLFIISLGIVLYKDKIRKRIRNGKDYYK